MLWRLLTVAVASGDGRRGVRWWLFWRRLTVAVASGNGRWGVHWRSLYCCCGVRPLLWRPRAVVGASVRCGDRVLPCLYALAVSSARCRVLVLSLSRLCAVAAASTYYCCGVRTLSLCDLWFISNDVMCILLKEDKLIKNITNVVFCIYIYILS